MQGCKQVLTYLLTLSLMLTPLARADIIYEIDGSPYGTHDAMVPEYIKSQGEKVILVDPRRHAWGAYNAKGRLIRWGIATGGASWCADIQKSCRTKSGSFRIYSAGDRRCVSSKYPVAEGGAAMPFCMYFNGGQAIHGANNVVMGNKSHGCVRVYYDDAKWLRYHFVEAPKKSNQFRGTKVIVRSY